MLTEVCDYIHNYFDYQMYEGSFTVSDGMIELNGLIKPGQRFRIRGSALNDGIYTYTDGAILDDDGRVAVNMADEMFTGTVTAMAVPPSFMMVVQDIADWIAENQKILNSPYQSESFGGYSYSKASGSGSNAGGALGWQDMFRAKLNAYRKIS